MRDPKQYELKIWPQSDNSYGTRKFKFIRKSPIPGYAKAGTPILLILTAIFAVYQLQTRDIQWMEWKKLPVLIVVLYLLNSLLCTVYQEDTEETLMVMRNIGIELSSTRPKKVFFMKSWPKEEFIPLRQILDIVIHEAFNGFEVIFYIVIMRWHRERLTIVFPTLLPRRPQLEVVLRGARKILFPTSEEMPAITKAY